MIAALHSWADETAELFERGMDYVNADNIRSIVRQYIPEGERQASRRAGTLRDHTRLRRAIRLADTVLDTILEDNADALKGWRYGAQPVNAAQRVYGMLYALAQEMSFAKFAIEAEYPSLVDQFDAERREYAASLASFRAEAPTEV